MADNFVESSFQVNIQSPEELAWWKKELAEKACMDWEFVENETTVWFHSDPNIDLEEAATTIQRFLKECRPEGSCGFSWAETCSKPRLDEFGGGACYVTAKQVWWHNTGDWLQDKYRQAAGMG